MRTLRLHLYLEAFLSVLSIFLGLYLLRDVISNSSRDTFPSLLVGSVLVTVGVVLTSWSIKTYAIMKSWKRAAGTAGYHGSGARGKFGPQ